jgi:hypothetical protein
MSVHDRWLSQSRNSAPELGIQGNCTQAAVASLLGLELCEVPDFNIGDTLAWHKKLEGFFVERGYELLRIDSHRHFRGLYLAGGPTRRGTQHMIVMRDGKIVHDPYPGGFGLTKVEHVWVPVPLDPKAFGSRRYLCRVCSVECDTEHTDGSGSICPECCNASEDGHKYEYEASERRWECTHCNEPPPDEWFDDPRGEI